MQQREFLRLDQLLKYQVTAPRMEYFIILKIVSIYMALKISNIKRNFPVSWQFHCVQKQIRKFYHLQSVNSDLIFSYSSTLH